MGMQPTKVDKAKLRAILAENRAKHRRVFEAALDGWHKAALARVEEIRAELLAGRQPDIVIRLTRPEDHTRDYDRVIGMLDMHTEDTWVLDEQNFARYVEDDWDWKRQWLRTSNSYAADFVETEYGAVTAD